MQEWCRQLLSSDQPIEMREVKAVDTENLLETTEDSDLDFSIEKIFEELDSEVHRRARIIQLRGLMLKATAEAKTWLWRRRRSSRTSASD